MEPVLKKTKKEEISGAEVENLVDFDISCDLVKSKNDNSNAISAAEEKTNGENVANGDNVKDENEAKNVRSNEEKMGMVHFVNASENRFSGIVKQRFSDFMVRECSTDGVPVRLTSLEHCDIKEEDPERIECPLKDESVINDLRAYVDRADGEEKFYIQVSADKLERKAIHQYIKQTYTNIETETLVVPDAPSRIVLSFKKAGKLKRKQSSWPKSRPKYCHFTLLKMNRDTMQCVGQLAKALHIPSARFGYAGTKDRRAVTVQRCSIQHVSSKQLSHVKIGNIHVGNFSYEPAEIRLGDLSGNQFTIVLRDVKATADVMNTSCTSLRDDGFINYFGLQRFGTGGAPTHEIGKLLLRNDYEAAVNRILTPRADGFDQEAAAKEVWTRTRDARLACRSLHSNFSYEGKLLGGLTKQSGNYWEALQSLPRNVRMLYTHSYQSFVWNFAVSNRIQKYGLKPTKGDLVLTGGKDANGYATAQVLKDDDDVSNHSIYDVVLPLPGYDVIYPDNDVTKFYRQTLADDGLNIDNMRNKVKELSLSGKYRKIMVKPGDMSWEIVDYQDYTKALVKNDYELLIEKQTANDEKEQEVLTGEKQSVAISACDKSTDSAGKDLSDSKSSVDIQTSENEQSEKSPDIIGDSNTTGRSEKEGLENSEIGPPETATPSLKALKLTFTLPSSCYATSALRELLTVETSFKVQSELNTN